NDAEQTNWTGEADMRRIVVTGLGLVSPLGAGVEQVWARLLAGESGIRRLPDTLVADLPAKIAGVVPDISQDGQAGFDADTVASSKEQRKMDRFMLLALAAAGEAIAQAGWQPEQPQALARTATVIASGVGGFPAIAKAVRTCDDR